MLWYCNYPVVNPGSNNFNGMPARHLRVLCLGYDQ